MPKRKHKPASSLRFKIRRSRSGQEERHGCQLPTSTLGMPCIVLPCFWITEQLRVGRVRYGRKP